MDKEVRVGLSGLNRYAASSELSRKDPFHLKGRSFASSRTDLSSTSTAKANQQLGVGHARRPTSV